MVNVLFFVTHKWYKFDESHVIGWDTLFVKMWILIFQANLAILTWGVPFLIYRQLILFWYINEMLLWERKNKNISVKTFKVYIKFSSFIQQEVFTNNCFDSIIFRCVHLLSGKMLPLSVRLTVSSFRKLMICGRTSIFRWTESSVIKNSTTL